VESDERQVALQSAPFRGRFDREHAGFDEMKAALPRGSAMAAYVRYSEGYLAFLIPAGGGAPVSIFLGSAQRIDSLVQRWRAQIDRERDFQGREAAKSEASYREAGNSLRRAVWDPIAAHLTGVRDLYLTTDGPLQLVNFSALPAP
jgi:hypothetical protein